MKVQVCLIDESGKVIRQCALYVSDDPNHEVYEEVKNSLMYFDESN